MISVEVVKCLKRGAVTIFGKLRDVVIYPKTDGCSGNTCKRDAVAFIRKLGRPLGPPSISIKVVKCF